jgi:hypothetical protein
MPSKSPSLTTNHSSATNYGLGWKLYRSCSNIKGRDSVAYICYEKSKGWGRFAKGLSPPTFLFIPSQVIMRRNALRRNRQLLCEPIG